MLVLRAVVPVMVVAVLLQAQCFALCTAIPCGDEHPDEAAGHETAAAPCHGDSSETPEPSHQNDSTCDAPHSEAERPSSPNAPTYAVTPTSLLAAAPLVRAEHAELHPRPLVSSSLRAIHVTVLLI